MVGINHQNHRVHVLRQHKAIAHCETGWCINHNALIAST
ncbi:Uncharacterised protein [Vibrio cholerae]|nr:Uncharacterised protein [Vibrio cholerae]